MGAIIATNVIMALAVVIADVLKREGYKFLSNVCYVALLAFSAYLLQLYSEAHSWN